uniref:ABC transporter domain-containing protein n=1 Tax=Ditylenchus dipsaci TaxID=166011 RepID=A0A915E7R5_9BILA
MGFLSQVCLLLQKELLVIKRSKIWFLCEFALGFLVFLMIYLVLTLGSEGAKGNSYSFEGVHITGDVDDLEREVHNIQSIHKRCCLKFPDRVLAYSSEDTILGRHIMQILEEKYNETFIVKEFQSLKKMEKSLKRDLNETMFCTKYIGGIYFSKINLTEPKLVYKILVPKKSASHWQHTKLSTLLVFGFLSFQFSIENIFLNLTGKEMDFDVFLQRMPMPESRVGGAAMFFKMAPIIWSLILLATMLHTTKNIVDEKEAGIKTYMMVMGLDSTAFYASHFLTGCFKMFIIIGACAGYLSTGLMNVSSSLFVAFSLAYGLSTILFAVLITTIVRRPAAAVMTIILGWIGLIAFNSLLKTSMNDVGFSMLASLNSFTAFKLGINAAGNYETRMEDLGWFNCFAGSTRSFTLGLAFLMLLFDCLCMALMIYYLDCVVPTDDSPRKPMLFFLKFLNPGIGKQVRMEIDDEPDGQNPDTNQEGEKGLNIDDADIDIQRIGQVTVLLGHNGAGKSTTFSALCGATTISSGNVWICQQSVVDNLKECQKQIGYCPQYNPLFAKLTVREHLCLYARLKSNVSEIKTRNLAADIDNLTSQVKLNQKLDVLAQNLSGGMKRKLCVAMSLIGDSRVVLLDEPTAGMDPEARHDVSTLLENAKRNRTVLLTTHYMDEADLLGDRIVIMVKGRVACNGSPEFLKNKFGTGYVLSIVVADESKGKIPFEDYIRKILQIVKKHAPEARVDKISEPEFVIILPVQYKKFFANLFDELENRQAEIYIRSFGLSFNTLEQVFLKVGEASAEQNNEDQVDSSRVLQFAADLFRPALLSRQLLNARRNQIRTFLPIVLSLMFFLIFGMSAKYLRGAKKTERDLSLSIMSEQHPVSIHYFFKQLTNTTKDRLLAIPSDTELHAALLKNAYASPPLGIGAAVFDYNQSVYALFNGGAFHSPPSTLLLISNAVLQKGIDAIQLSLQTYGDTIEEDLINALLDMTSTVLVALVVILAFASMTSTFVMPLVEDRQRRFKHQMTLTKMHICTYWVAVLMWNLLLYAVFCILLALILMTFGWVENCLGAYFILWGFYFWCCVPFVYCASFLFDSAIRAYTALLCWMVVSMVVIIFFSVAGQFISPDLSNTIAYIAAILLPSYSLAKGLTMVTPQCLFMDETELQLWNSLKDTIYPMLISGILFWTILVLLQSKKVSLMYHKFSCRLRRPAYQVICVENEQMDDKDVAKERVIMRTVDDTELQLAVRELYKYYGRFCAVRNLTFGIKHSDCFGLLGVNGAGKTTTFDILTGLSFPSSGCAIVGGLDVVNSPTIGYCPQFDALPLDLTGRETLLLLARLNGFVDAAERVDRVLFAIHMADHANKLVQYYSGGQKRRLSIGITLISKARLIMLDEPTAGIDPTARRHIWQLLLAVRQQNVAILLTSHSMEECEVLCNRIGFMNKGSLVGIGTSQHLKSRFGNSFLLSFTIENPSAATSSFLDSLVVHEFHAFHTHDSPTMSTLHWEIPKNNFSWGQLFHKAQAIADKYPAGLVSCLPLGSETPLIKDFSVTQNSLEQVFLRMAHLDGVERNEQEGGGEQQA